LAKKSVEILVRPEEELDHGPSLLAAIRERLLSLPDAAELFPGYGPPTAVGREKAETLFLKYFLNYCFPAPCIPSGGGREGVPLPAAGGFSPSAIRLRQTP
jgi:hypothetical protein